MQLATVQITPSLPNLFISWPLRFSYKLHALLGWFRTDIDPYRGDPVGAAMFDQVVTRPLFASTASAAFVCVYNV